MYPTADPTWSKALWQSVCVLSVTLCSVAAGAREALSRGTSISVDEYDNMWPATGYREQGGGGGGNASEQQTREVEPMLVYWWNSGVDSGTTFKQLGFNGLLSTYHSQQHTLGQCRFNVGPASQTVDHNCHNIGLVIRVYQAWFSLAIQPMIRKLQPLKSPHNSIQWASPSLYTNTLIHANELDKPVKCSIHLYS